MLSKDLRIRIITIHGIPNFGSVFQTMALCRYLQASGYSDVKVIDYNPAYFKTRTIRTIAGALLNYPAYRKRNKLYRSFLTENIPLTEKSYSDFESLACEDFGADVYIAGGDQLWNVYHDCGRDDAYKLTFTDGKKISYGTSLGQSDFTGEQLDDLVGKIREFAALSVRESSSVSLLASRGLQAKHVVDPVFLLDPKEYDKYLVDPKQDPYLLVYLVTPSKLLDDCVRFLANKYSLKVILCSGLSRKCTCDEHVKDIGPAEILSYVKNAEIVLSASFHASAFSTIFEKQFFTILPDAHTNERILDFLTIRGLSDRIITENCNLKKELEATIDYSNLPDYQTMIASSKQFLNDSLED